MVMLKRFRGMSENRKVACWVSQRIELMLPKFKRNTFVCFDPVCTVFSWKGHIKCQAMVNDATEENTYLPIFFILSMICTLSKCWVCSFLGSQVSIYKGNVVSRTSQNSEGPQKATIFFGNILRTKQFLRNTQRCPQTYYKL